MFLFTIKSEVAKALKLVLTKSLILYQSLRLPNTRSLEQEWNVLAWTLSLQSMRKSSGSVPYPVWNVLSTLPIGKCSRKTFGFSGRLLQSLCSFPFVTRRFLFAFDKRTTNVASTIHHNHVTFSGFLDMNSANDSARWDIQLYSPLVTWQMLFLFSSCSTLPGTIFQSYLRSILSFLRGQI